MCAASQHGVHVGDSGRMPRRATPNLRLRTAAHSGLRRRATTTSQRGRPASSGHSPIWFYAIDPSTGALTPIVSSFLG
jgi:hypothetical protein